MDKETGTLTGPFQVKVYCLLNNGRWRENGLGTLQVFTTSKGNLLQILKEDRPDEIMLEAYVTDGTHSVELEKDSIIILRMCSSRRHGTGQDTWRNIVVETKFIEDGITSALESPESVSKDGREKECAISFANEDECKQVWLFLTSGKTDVGDSESSSPLGASEYEKTNYLDTKTNNVHTNEDFYHEQKDTNFPLSNERRNSESQSPPSSNVNGENPVVELENHLCSSKRESDKAQFTSDTEIGLSNVDTLKELLETSELDKKEEFFIQVKNNPSVIEKLLELFRTCEDLKIIQKLHTLANIFYKMLISGNCQIVELLLSDAYYYDVMGALEYLDVSTSGTSSNSGYQGVRRRPKYRKCIRKMTSLEGLVVFHDSNIATKVKINQRLMYLKQNFFPSLSEDHVLTGLNSMIFFNNLDIVNYFRLYPESLNSLFKTLMKASFDGDNQLQNSNNGLTFVDILRFFHELCDLCKSQQHQQYNSERIFGIFRVEDLLSLCSKFLLASNVFEERFFSTGIILMVLTNSPPVMRDYIFQHSELFEAIVTCLKREDDFALSCTLTDIICMLLDPETTKDFLQKDAFLDLFYDSIVHQLVDIFRCLEEDSLKDTGTLLDAIPPFGNASLIASCQVCNILSYCVANHGYRPKYFMWRHNMLVKVAALFRYGDICVSLYPLRLIRRCIGQKDEFYNRYIIKENILGLVLQAAETFGTRKNIFYSSVLEMFSFIEQGGMVPLLNHIKKIHLPLLKRTYPESNIVQKIQRFSEEKTDVDGSEQATAKSSDGNGIGEDSFLGKRRMADLASEEEERYFEENDDEQETTGNETDWNIDKDIILPPTSKRHENEEDSMVFFHLQHGNDSTVSPKAGRKRLSNVTVGKIGSKPSLVSYDWTEEDQMADNS
eukprot:jgi/Galph1/1141/GphlegSOOS_G5885.1